jgi:arginine decarboxylase
MKIKSAKKTKGPKEWTIQDARDLYNTSDWSMGFFDINSRGNMAVLPTRSSERQLDLKVIIDELKERGIMLPVIIRFSDVLKARIRELNDCFRKSIKEWKYKGKYMSVFPIKVNQHREVVEEVINEGRQFGFGLEAGTKPELLLAISFMETNRGLIICNGYKDDEYIRTALMATKVGKQVFLVVEKLSELPRIIAAARKMKVKPNIGIRLKLSARGRGKWEGSGGDSSKFGLFVYEVIRAVEILRKHRMLKCLKLMHFHLGSQVTSIQSIKQALTESSQIYVELRKMGVKIEFFDVGGGLAVDYDGSKTNFPSSSNYSMEEYASDVVYTVAEACAETKVPYPTLISESGRSIVAAHSLLVFEVLGTSEIGAPSLPVKMEKKSNPIVQEMFDCSRSITRKNFQEVFHDIVQIRDEARSLFNLGYLSLEERANFESLFYNGLRRILKLTEELEYIPDEFEGLERFLADTYFCNFSVFKNLPDHWAVKQLFPIVPLHRHREKPARLGTLADITCDSDGKIDQFIDLRDVRDVLPLPSFREGEPLYLAAFLMGAYQEVLGDYHNLFGDVNTVHISLDEEDGYNIDKLIHGDQVHDVLGYMEYSRGMLVNRFRKALEGSARERRITLKESAAFLRAFERGLEGYTYLES